MDSQGCTEILKSLETDDVSRVILVGEAGTGKTWLARRVCERATSKDGLFYIALWLNLNKDFDEVSLYENIGSQLSLFLDNKQGEEGESDEEDSEDEEDRTIQDFMRLKDQIHQKITRKKKLKGVGKKYPLLVLDDEGSVTKEEKVMKELHLADFLAPYQPLKILLVRRKGEENAIDRDGEIQPHASDELHDTPASYTIDVSWILRDMNTDRDLMALLKFLINDELLETIEKSWGKDNGFLAHRIVEMSMCLPAAVVVLAKSLNRIAQKTTFCISPQQEEIFKNAVLNSFPSVSVFDYVHDIDHKRAMSRCNLVLHLSYKLLETDFIMNSSVIDCFCHSLSFFEHCGCVSFQELITHWILEGYFDPVRSVKKAYKYGHAILMELIKRGFMKVQEENVVMPEVAMKNLFDLRHCGLSGASRIGIAKVCGSDMKKGLGKTNLVGDTIEAVQGKGRREKVTTVLVSGNRLRRETPEKYFEKLIDLEILGLFQPELDSVVPFLSKLVKLRVLVIRGCNLLKDIEELKALQGLHALEVSGASSLKKISDDFFLAMPELQSLHLCGLQIKSSPSSISQLKNLHRLIIRDCTKLEDLPDIHELLKLEVVNVSGARGLQTCFDKEKKDKSKNTNFYQLQHLQLLDLSETQIDRLPIFQNAEEPAKLHSLTRLLLRNCKKLVRLPNLTPLSGLQILDLSGTTSLMKMLEVCFEDKKELRVLNLSGSNLRQLPSTIEKLSNLSELLLRDCINLETLPNIEKLTNLEVFDVSGCSKLHTIEGSFEDMPYLREINLLGTKVNLSRVLPKEKNLGGSKRIILADSSCFQGESWSQIVEAITTSQPQKRILEK